jgi:hypothetical protein
VVSSVGLAVVASVAAYVVGSLVTGAQVTLGRAVYLRFLLVLPARPDDPNTGGGALSAFEVRRRVEVRQIIKVRLLDQSEALHAEIDARRGSDFPHGVASVGGWCCVEALDELEDL